MSKGYMIIVTVLEDYSGCSLKLMSAICWLYSCDDLRSNLLGGKPKLELSPDSGAGDRKFHQGCFLKKARRLLETGSQSFPAEDKGLQRTAVNQW